MLIFPRERDTFPDESGKSEDARNGRQGHLPDGFGPDRVLAPTGFFETGSVGEPAGGISPCPPFSVRSFSVRSLRTAS